jgi:hypothetical protein
MVGTYSHVHTLVVDSSEYSRAWCHQLRRRCNDEQHIPAKQCSSRLARALKCCAVIESCGRVRPDNTNCTYIHTYLTGPTPPAVLPTQSLYLTSLCQLRRPLSSTFPSLSLAAPARPGLASRVSSIRKGISTPRCLASVKLIDSKGDRRSTRGIDKPLLLALLPLPAAARHIHVARHHHRHTRYPSLSLQLCLPLPKATRYEGELAPRLDSYCSEPAPPPPRTLPFIQRPRPWTHRTPRWVMAWTGTTPCSTRPTSSPTT